MRLGAHMLPSLETNGKSGRATRSSIYAEWVRLKESRANAAAIPKPTLTTTTIRALSMFAGCVRDATAPSTESSQPHRHGQESKEMEISREIAIKVLEVVDAGLVNGVGNPVPGQMCVEAAVCYAMGLPHSDDPGCVSSALRSLKIRLNDSNWSSNEARAKGLRRLAVAQLGSRGVLDDAEFVRRVVELAIRKSVPAALRAAASCHPNPKHRAELNAAADRCEAEPTRSNAIKARTAAAYAAYAAANANAAANAAAYAAANANANANANAAANAAAYAAANAAANANANAAANANANAARDKSLAEFAEEVVQLLVEMNAPGCQWLDLAELAD